MQTIPSMNARFVLPALALLVVVLGAGCASSGAVNPQITAKISSVNRSEKALLVVYRVRTAQGRAWHPTVTMNGADLVSLGNGETFVASLDAGHYRFEMDDKKSSADVILKKGDTLYLRVDFFWGVWTGGGKLVQVASEQGAAEAGGLQPVGSDGIDDPRFR